MSFDGYNSPSMVDAPLKYITVETYPWPQSVPAERSRLDDDERRRRHCECQKRFLARKRRHLEQLHRDIRILELQVKYLEMLRETRVLTLERDQLMTHQSKNTSTWTPPWSATMETASLADDGETSRVLENSVM